MYVGLSKLNGEDLNYFGIQGLRIAGNQGIIIIAVCQVNLLPRPYPAPTSMHRTQSTTSLAPKLGQRGGGTQGRSHDCMVLQLNWAPFLDQKGDEKDPKCSLFWDSRGG